MNRYQIMTLAFVLGTFALIAAAWIAWDLWVLASPPRRAADATISRVMLLMARKSPLWVAAWTAVVVGLIVHFWGSQDTCEAAQPDPSDPIGPADPLDSPTPDDATPPDAGPSPTPPPAELPPE